MKLTAEFTEKSIVAAHLFSDVLPCLTESEFDELFPFLMEEEFRIFSGCTENLITALHSLEISDIGKARMAMGHNGLYYPFSSDITALRYEIKSLMSGFIITRSLASPREIKDLQAGWAKYDKEKDEDSYGYHHYLLYSAFKRVNTHEELVAFNSYFRQYLGRMVLNLSAIMIRRMNYTIDSLRNEKQLEDSCRDIASQLENFSNEIGKLEGIFL
ncbi:MAG: hypothetical protein WCK34_06210 [Bacteroidota bacterium]